MGRAAGTVTTRPRRRPHRHRERMARDLLADLLADLHYLAGPEGAGRDAKARVRDGDWPELERRKQNHLRSLMEDGTRRQHRAPRPWSTPSSGLVGKYTITIEQYHAWHERREPVSVVLPPLRLATSDATAAGWVRTAGEAQSEPQPA